MPAVRTAKTTSAELVKSKYLQCAALQRRRLACCAIWGVGPVMYIDASSHKYSWCCGDDLILGEDEKSD